MPASGCGVPQRLVEDRVPVAALRLGAVHRRIGSHEQLGRRRGVLAPAERDPDARGHEQLVLAVRDRGRDGAPDALDDGQGLGIVVEVLQDDHELVATPSAEGVARAHGVAEPLPHGLQDLVADVVRQRVVDPLEVVEVHEQHGQRWP